ncbi:transposase subunit B [Bifidobacterium bifidum]|nr:transposase subunit B [Bifidobacterium bifidum]
MGRSHGGADGLTHRSGHGARCTGLVYATGVGEFGMLPSTGTVGDSYGNAMAESADGAYRTELVWRRKPSGIRGTWNRRRSGGSRGGDSKRLHRSLGHRTPEQTETEYYANQAAQAVPL